MAKGKKLPGDELFDLDDIEEDEASSDAEEDAEFHDEFFGDEEKDEDDEDEDDDDDEDVDEELQTDTSNFLGALFSGDMQTAAVLQAKLTPPPSPSKVIQITPVGASNILLMQAGVANQPQQYQYQPQVQQQFQPASVVLQPAQVQPQTQQVQQQFQPQVAAAPSAATVQQQLNVAYPPADYDALITKQPTETQAVYDYRRRWAELSREVLPSLTPIQSETIGFYAAQVALLKVSYPNEITQYVTYTKAEICKKYPTVC